MKNSRFAYFYTNSKAFIRERYVFIRESFTLILESYAFIRESYTFVRKSVEFIHKTFALIREKYFFPTKMSPMGFRTCTYLYILVIKTSCIIQHSTSLYAFSLCYDLRNDTNCNMSINWLKRPHFKWQFRRPKKSEITHNTSII